MLNKISKLDTDREKRNCWITFLICCFIFNWRYQSISDYYYCTTNPDKNIDRFVFVVKVDVEYNRSLHQMIKFSSFCLFYSLPFSFVLKMRWLEFLLLLHDWSFLYINIDYVTSIIVEIILFFFITSIRPNKFNKINPIAWYWYVNEFHYFFLYSRFSLGTSFCYHVLGHFHIRKRLSICLFELYSTKHKIFIM